MQKKILVLVGIIVLVAIAVGGYFTYQKFGMQPGESNPVACTMEAKQCPDGSYVGRTGPNCEFTQCPVVADWKTYTNNEYGFELKFQDSWKGYSVINNTWTGNKLEESGTISGPLVIFRNPNWTEQKKYQDVPVMVFTHDQWNLVLQEKVAVSAAPIGPGKIGENAKYVFATPPRWHGFTDALNEQEAVEIVGTFKAF